MKPLYFDYAAFLIFLILIITTISRKMTKGRLNRCFIDLLFVEFIAVTADIFSVWLNNRGAGLILPKYMASCIYLLVHNLTTPMYVLYVMILTDTDYKLNNKLKHFFCLPFIAVFIAMCTNPFTKCIFYLNENDQYTRGPLFFILYISAVIYMLHGLYLLLRYGKGIGARQVIGIGAIIPLVSIAMIIQMKNPNVILEMLAHSLALLITSTIIHRPEDIIDTTTGLSNKTAFINTVRRCITNKKPLELILVNITNHKSLESIVGFSGMDDIVRIMTSRITSISKANSMFSEMFYLGDGRFCFEMSFRHLNSTNHMAQAINDIMSKSVDYNGMELNLITTVCIAKCPEDIPDLETLLAFENDITAETYTGNVLYASEIFSKNHYALVRQIDSIIENALTNNRFEVYYQPIYSIREDKFNSAEALIRLKDESFGFISPEFFIPAAEKSGAIHRIGFFVLEEVCKFISSDEFKNLNMDYIEVNLSVVQCMHNNLDRDIMNILNKYNVSPSQINLEITETAASNSQDSMLENLNHLEKQGLSFSLDDYGTGYSNMDRISSMNFHIIKLDKSFVNYKRDAKRDKILESNIQMIQSLGMQIVVEGVENAEVLQKFADLRCNYIQGYFFSKPLPKNAFIDYINAHNHHDIDF